MTLPARKEGIIPGAANLRLWRFTGDRIARQAILYGRRLDCDTPEGRLICDEIAPPASIDAALDRVIDGFTSSGVVSAAGNRRAIRVGQEPLDHVPPLHGGLCARAGLLPFQPGADRQSRAELERAEPRRSNARAAKFMLVEAVFLRVVQFGLEIGERDLDRQHGAPGRVEPRLDRVQAPDRSRRHRSRAMRLRDRRTALPKACFDIVQCRRVARRSAEPIGRSDRSIALIAAGDPPQDGAIASADPGGSAAGGARRNGREFRLLVVVQRLLEILQRLANDIDRHGQFLDLRLHKLQPGDGLRRNLARAGFAR